MSGRCSFPPAVLFRCRDAVSAGDQRRDGAFPFLAGTAGALVGGLQNIGSACWRRSLRCCRKPVRAAWGVDDLNGIVDRAMLATAGDAESHQGQPV